MICTIHTVLGTHYCTMQVKGIEGGFIGQGFTNREALDNCFKAYFKSL